MGMDWRIAVVVVFAVAGLLAAPWWFGTFGLWLMMQTMLLVLFALGFNLLLGYTGLLSFGQAGFFATGAYVCALILLEAPSLLLGIVGGVLAAGVVALVLGYLCVRLTEIYFAMLTLSFGMMIHSLVWRWRDVTGGDDGLTGVPRAPLELPGLRIELFDIPSYYYFVLVTTLAAVWFMWRIVNSPLGLTFQAIRDSAVRASFVGIPIRRFRLWAFVIAGLYAGLAGSLLAPLERTITPIYAH
jgi:branched-chain amino acid transport system permease protein